MVSTVLSIVQTTPVSALTLDRGLTHPLDLSKEQAVADPTDSRTCSIDGCNRPIHGRGLCTMHYQRARKDGTWKPVTFADRFWSHVDRRTDDACWPWTGTHDAYGYGRISVHNRPQLAHRIMYSVSVGPIPDGVLIDHECRNPNCVNPRHLRLATHGQNHQNLNPRANNSSGYRGVSYEPGRRGGPWRASVTFQGRKVFNRYFHTAQEAADAAREVRLNLFTHTKED